tara:strand:- start:4338 stop:4928 length:591 start_codon:yes stop_codon:yes gene_type:complete
MDIKKTLSNISNGQPTPGGGAVGWLVWGQGTGLLRMVSNLTLKSKKWLDGHAISDSIITQTTGFEDIAIRGYNEDCKAYDTVVEAYRMDKEEQGRINAIQSASLLAAEIPLDLVSKVHDVSLLHADLRTKYNKNAHSDFMSSKHLLATSAIIGAYNVKANLPEISDLDRHAIASKLYDMMNEIENMLSITLDWSGP